MEVDPREKHPMTEVRNSDQQRDPRNRYVDNAVTRRPISRDTWRYTPHLTSLTSLIRGR